MQTWLKNDEIQPHSVQPDSSQKLSLAIRNLILEEVSNDVEEQLPIIKDLAIQLRQKISILTMDKSDFFKDVSGVDAGSQVLPLASRRYAVISALVYSLKLGSCFYNPPESFSYSYLISESRFNGVVSVRREAKLYETAFNFLQKRDGVRLVLVDGPLAFSNWWRLTGKTPDRQRLIDAVNNFLNLCDEKEVTVAGVVKRPSARYLISHLKFQDETDISDAFLLLQALKPGERTEVFSPRAALMRATGTIPFMDAIGYPIFSFYGRFAKDWFLPPIRIDIPEFSLGYIDEIAEYCHLSSFWNGIPLPIVHADEEVRISKAFLSEVYGEMVGHIGVKKGCFSHLAPFWGDGEWMGV